MKLTAELVPESCWFSNVRSEVTPAQWEYLKRKTAAAANNACEICGGRGPRWPVECHEVWVYEDSLASGVFPLKGECEYCGPGTDEHPAEHTQDCDAPKVQRLERLVALCPACHQVKHFGLSGKRGLTDEVEQHFCKVNGCTLKVARAYFAEQMRVWARRSELEWILDISALDQLLAGYRSPEKMGTPKLPSKVKDAPWIYAVRAEGKYPEPTERNGKWLVFVPRPQIDGVWETIAGACRAGRLGNSVKVSTAAPNPYSNDTHVICVYTYDWHDRTDVMKIREVLGELGIRWGLPYKTDEDTLAGRYQGDGKVAKYYV